MVETRLTQAHAVVDRLDRLNLPTVAVIHGFCLGGGLELALACDYRIAIDDARFGFPEVMLGLHPGLGGTVRAPHLINPIEAMTMMLTGRTVRAGRARSIGLVDAVTQERHVRAAVSDAVAGKLKSSRRRRAGDGDQQLARPQVRGKPHARADRQEGADRALSGAVRADRSLGAARRRQSGDAEGGDRIVRAPPGHRHVAQPGAGVLPAREAQGPRRRQMVRQARACHRRGRDGRRHRGLVRLARPHRDARRHEGRAARRRDQARRRALRQDRPQEHDHCATRSTG